MDKYHTCISRTRGTHSLQELESLKSSIFPQDLYWKQGMKTWEPIQNP